MKILNSKFIIQNFPYPLLLQPYSPGLHLYIPDPQQVKSVYEKLLVTHPGLPFPFWAKVWPAAHAMAAFLLSHPEWTHDKKVLEIGAGIGLPSFSIAGKAASLIISDHDPAAVALLEKNIALLGLSHANAMSIDWNHFPSDISADTILLSDVNYSPEQFEVLLTLIRQWLDAGTTVVLSTPQRIMGVPFVAALTNYIVQQRTSSIEESGVATDISILVLQKNNAPAS